MTDWGKGTYSSGTSVIQTEVWRRLFSGLDSSPQAFILLDREQKVLACNLAAVQLAELLKGRPLQTGDLLSVMFPADAWESIEEPLKSAYTGTAGSQSVNLVDRILTLYFSPLLSNNDSAGLVLLNVVITITSLNYGHLRQSTEQPPDQLKDRITTLEQANRQLKGEIERLAEAQLVLQASETFFRQNFQGLPEPTIIWGKDEQGEIRLRFANQAAADLAGSTPGEMNGLLLEDFFAHSLHFVGMVETTFTKGEVHQAENLYISSVKNEPRWVSSDCVRLSEMYVLNTLRDISQQKNRQLLDENDRNQIELLRQAMTAFTSVLNLEQVMRNVLEYLQKLIPYHRVMLFLLDGNETMIEATSGFSPDADPLGKSIPARNPQFEAINRNRLPLFLPNALEYRPFEGLGELNCGASWLGVPLMGHGQILGYISLYHNLPAVYNAGHARLAEIFANEASIAIENARLFEQVQLLAVTDELTGFYNRRYFYELVEIELARSRRYHHPTSLIMIDLDHFKQVNDRFGHTTGDQVLQEICATIRKAVRESDVLGRHGGEEFVLLLPETPFDRAVDVAERLRLLVESHPIQVENAEITVSISAGVSAFGDACTDADALFRCADIAMYRAKDAGRNQVAAY